MNVKAFCIDLLRGFIRGLFPIHMRVFKMTHDDDTDDTMPVPVLSPDDSDDYRYGGTMHQLYGDAWLYADCPEAW
jgi:hypothetical protein